MFCLGKRWCRGIFLVCVTIWWWGAKTEPGFSVVPSESTRGHVLKYRKFHLNIRKNFFHCKAGITVEQVARADCGVSILEYN